MHTVQTAYKHNKKYYKVQINYLRAQLAKIVKNSLRTQHITLAEDNYVFNLQAVIKQLENAMHNVHSTFNNVQHSTQQKTKSITRLLNVMCLCNLHTQHIHSAILTALACIQANTHIISTL